MRRLRPLKGVVHSGRDRISGPQTERFVGAVGRSLKANFWNLNDSLVTYEGSFIHRNRIIGGGFGGVWRDRNLLLTFLTLCNGGCGVGGN